MSRYAIIESGLVANIAEAEAAYAEAQGWIAAPDNVSTGYTYDATTDTWTAPVPPPPTAQQTARTQVQQLAATIPTQVSNAQADASTIAAMTAGQAPNAAQIAALTRHANGWVSLLEGLSALVTALGMDT